MGKIFINYRTDDEHWAAAFINDTLSDRFGTGNVFFASKSIPLGDDFEKHLLPAVRASAALVAVIGRRWLEHGRIQKPDDWVRRELAEAFRLKIPVIPVLLNADRLTAGDLPPDIAPLAKCQYIRLDHRNHHNDLARLTAELFTRVQELAADDTGSTTATAPPPDEPWQAGEEVQLGSASFLLQQQTEEHVSDTHTWAWRYAPAERLDPMPAPVFLRQVRRLRRSTEWQQQRAALIAEADLLKELDTVPGMPRLLEAIRDADHVTLVLRRTKASTLRRVYGPTTWPLDHLRTVDFLLAVRRFCAVLHELHKRGHSHRALSPDVIVLAGNGAEVSIRDLGNAAVAADPVTYQAPEQFLSLRQSAGDGARTDVYQLAAIVYHVLTAHPPSPTGSPPPTAVNPRLPSSADELLARALDVVPDVRPADANAFSAGLSTVIDQLRRGGPA
ncbi:TIR domain-containing protein [Actinocrispum wychmicini]|uniref:TIR domain-containing protein n=1 Tax=Actinocrispum wychmicini TaxID=1213861 RepID=UPI001404C2CA|nr:TIR domain-containing protein [Actinocrispum wychmicini]